MFRVLTTFSKVTWSSCLLFRWNANINYPTFFKEVFQIEQVSSMFFSFQLLKVEALLIKIIQHSEFQNIFWNFNGEIDKRKQWTFCASQHQFLIPTVYENLIAVFSFFHNRKSDERSYSTPILFTFIMECLYTWCFFTKDTACSPCLLIFLFTDITKKVLPSLLQNSRTWFFAPLNNSTIKGACGILKTLFTTLGYWSSPNKYLPASWSDIEHKFFSPAFILLKHCRPLLSKSYNIFFYLFILNTMPMFDIYFGIILNIMVNRKFFGKIA